LLLKPQAEGAVKNRNVGLWEAQ